MTYIGRKWYYFAWFLLLSEHASFLGMARARNAERRQWMMDRPRLPRQMRIDHPLLLLLTRSATPALLIYFIQVLSLNLVTNFTSALLLFFKRVSTFVGFWNENICWFLLHHYSFENCSKDGIPLLLFMWIPS